MLTDSIEIGAFSSSDNSNLAAISLLGAYCVYHISDKTFSATLFTAKNIVFPGLCYAGSKSYNFAKEYVLPGAQYLISNAPSAFYQFSESVSRASEDVYKTLQSKLSQSLEKEERDPDTMVLNAMASLSSIASANLFAT